MVRSLKLLFVAKYNRVKYCAPWRPADCLVRFDIQSAQAGACLGCNARGFAFSDTLDRAC